MRFTHLHTHSHYSLLDGLPKIPALVAQTKKLGMDAVALTDHGSMFGTIEFYKEANKQGIKPIIGVETYVAPNAHTDKRARIDDNPFHLILLAENNEGYKNLLQLVSTAYLDGFYYKPRIDRELLRQHSKGVIALSGCLGGEIAQLLLSDDIEAAKRTAETYRSFFGEENYFFEIQKHKGMTEQEKVNGGLIQLSKELSIPLVATKDSHYLHQEDAEAQDALVCVQTGKQVTDEKRLDMRSMDLHFTSPEEMSVLFRDLPDAVAQSAVISDRCQVEIKLGTWIFPEFTIPKEKDADTYLREQCEEQLVERFGVLTPEAKQRLDYELGIIKTKGYATYFLVVADFGRWTREQGIVSTTRGSAAGSLVAYALGITTVDPLVYQLPFERFLNPYRPSPPDIDMDFADDRRDEVIGYVKERYGEDRVAQIVTFGTMQARAAVRDIGRVLGYSYGLCDRVAKTIPLGSQGFPMTIKKALEIEPELKKMYEEESEVQRLLNLAQKVEGCVRHASVHAAGVVITPGPLVEYMPLMREAGGDKVITQFEMHACEDVGVLKMDFLGIRNLAILGSAIELVEKLHGKAIDLDRLPLDDKKTYQLLSRGETAGLFQLGGSGMTRYLKELRPTTIHDIMAMVALFRPGPMENIPEYIRRKREPKLVTYLHPRLKPILERSYGILTYQDDILMIAIEVAGYTWAEADKLRKAVGKKIPEEMEAQKEKFISGCMKHGGLTGAQAEELWKLIEPFAAYGFGKAHAASYGIVAYQTAYMKANYPSEYMTAVLKAESGNQEKIAEVIEECRRMEIEVLPPSINESRQDFTRLDDNHIRFGLSAIKNVGEEVTRVVTEERERGGPFASLENFLQRVQGRNINKKFLESLIKVGGLDEWGERTKLLHNVEAMLAYNRSFNSAMNTKQESLFEETELVHAPLLLDDCPAADSKQFLLWERDLLGLYLTEHPLQEFADVLDPIIISLSTLPAYRADDIVAAAGVVESVRTITTKKGDPMCFVKIADTSGSAEVIVFPNTLQKTGQAMWQIDNLLLVAAKVSRRDGDPQLVADTAEQVTGEKIKSTVSRWSKLQYIRREMLSTE